jgi:hypothetical protein
VCVCLCMSVRALMRVLMSVCPHSISESIDRDMNFLLFDITPSPGL